ncbi:sensor histidine kinase [Pseudonocardia sp. GCM10023141]|uniref:sensor histidine kinase n=1 Tax=Pseudonocardia sp. GCM10023141 TaxID=3252653 RepID=UPI0036127759
MATTARRRIRGVAGWAVFGACCAWVVVGAFTGLGVTDLTGRSDYLAGDAVFVLGFTGLGALVLARQPGNRAGLLCLTPALIAVSAVCGNYALLAGSAGLPGAEWALWATRWIWLVGLAPVLTLLPMVLPDGRLPHPGWRPIAWLVAVVVVALPVAVALAPAAPGEPPNIAAVAALGPVTGWSDVAAVAWVVCCAVALLSLVHRFVLAGGQQRAQVAWVALGMWIFAIGRIVEPWLPAAAATVVGFGASLALPLACSIAILRHDLLALDGLLRRLLSAVVLATALTAAVLGLRALLGTGPVPTVAVAVGLGLLTPLVHRWLGGRVSRLLHGRRGSPAQALAGLAHRLAGASGPDDVLAAVATVVHAALPVTSVRVELASAGTPLRHAIAGAAGGTTTERVALQFQGAVLGSIEVAARGVLDAGDRSLLTDLAASAGAAVAAAHRASQLLAAHTELLAAREQERRRIARDLHDGVGPVLSGLGFTLDAVGAAAGDTDVIAQARAQVREAVQLVRRVASTLRPAPVEPFGLVGALRELAARHDGPGLAVRVDAGDLGELDAAREGAAHAIVAEALTNVARHSAASRCTITLTRRFGGLDVQVDDDGIGTAGAAAGFGRTSMAERAAELGGWCDVAASELGGTRVHAHLPAGPP